MNGFLRGRWVAGFGVGLMVVTLLAGSMGSLPIAPGSSALLGPSTTALTSLQVSITVAPPTVTQGSSQTFTAQVSGGLGPFTYVWQNSAPGCPSQPEQSWSCTASSPGSYTVSVTVTNGTGATGSSSQNYAVTSSGNGNGGGNNNGGQGNSNNNNNNGSNGFNLSAFGPILFYGVIAGIVVFALLIALTVAVIVIAVTLVRRLPKPPKGGVLCPSCQAAAPLGAKFCPSCASPLAPGKK